MSSSDGGHSHLHVALLPSSGMGHLLPFLRLAASLIRQQRQVTLITTHPIVSIAESQLISRFLFAFPQVTEQKFTLLPLDPLTVNSNDPFALQWETILTTKLCLPNYILFTSSARMFSLFAYFPSIAASVYDDGSFQFGDEIRIPGLDSPIPMSSLPAALLDSSSLLARNFSDNSQSIRNVNGVLINSFEGLEKQSLGMLNGGEVMKELPPLFPVGPFCH
ncbi:hypothetical protein DITRI_Ditri17bG0118500 [Diplodiscus trichospermus]